MSRFTGLLASEALTSAKNSVATDGKIHARGLEKARAAGLSGEAAHEYAIECELGFSEATEAAGKRLSAIVSDPRMKGRERAALDLACKSPNMTAEEVVAFVLNNVRQGSGASSLAARAAEDESVGHEAWIPAQAEPSLSIQEVYRSRREAVASSGEQQQRPREGAATASDETYAARRSAATPGD